MLKGKHIENADDERAIGNGVIITLAYGFSFEGSCHEGVRGFDNFREARAASARRKIHICNCQLCKDHLK